MNYLNLCLGLLIASCSCNESTNKASVKSQTQLCEKLSDDSLISLEGTIHITTDGAIIFEDVKSRSEWKSKIHLIPCSEHLKNYIFSYYNSFIYVKNFEDKSWVLIEGQYISADTLERPQQFLFNFVAIIDEPEA